MNLILLQYFVEKADCMVRFSQLLDFVHSCVIFSCLLSVSGAAFSKQSAVLLPSSPRLLSLCRRARLMRAYAWCVRVSRGLAQGGGGGARLLLGVGEAAGLTGFRHGGMPSAYPPEKIFAQKYCIFRFIMIE